LVHERLLLLTSDTSKGAAGPAFFQLITHPRLRGVLPGNDYVFGNGGADQVAHSYGNDRIFGGCGSDTVRGGFGLDRIFANMPDGLYPPGTTCVTITAPLTAEQITAFERAVNDVPDSDHDLVDCAWLGSRGDPQPDEGFGSVEEDGVRDDTVVDCSNRDDQ